ncbi:MAG TPA: IS3 family transposase, partial [Natronosporangium sp.]|nr:IS3 family transposase [Natronosporangium sp.]
MTRFRLIEAEKAHHSVFLLCRVLGVRRGSFCAWCKRGPSQRACRDAELTGKIRTIHSGSRGTYGAARVHAELGEEYGERVGRKRVARLMRSAGRVGCHRRRHRVGLTRQDRQASPSSDLVGRDFSAPAPNVKWTADITYIPTWEGWL